MEKRVVGRNRHLQLAALKRRSNGHPHLHGLGHVARVKDDGLPKRTTRIPP